MIKAKLQFDSQKIADAIAEEIQKKLDSMECFDDMPEDTKQDIFEVVHYEIKDFFQESNGVELEV